MYPVVPLAAVGVTVNVPEAATVCGPLMPEPATGDGVIVTRVALVVPHCKVVLSPNRMLEGLAAIDPATTGVTLMVSCRALDSSAPEQPESVPVRVKIVDWLTVKDLDPPDGLTGTDMPDVPSAIVAAPAPVAAHDRVTVAPGVTQ